jgi:hypothetical protein
MSVYRLEVRHPDGTLLKAGTAWRVTANLLVTAFHVVGEDYGRWLHTMVDGAQYHLLDGGQILDKRLIPIGENSYSDIAVLKTTTPLSAPIMLLAASDPADDSRWSSDGFPSVTGERVFRLTGRVAAVHPNEKHELQLTVDQGGSNSWEGASGSPVCVGEKVVGILTQEVCGLNTVRAVRAATLIKLLVGLGINDGLVVAPTDQTVAGASTLARNYDPEVERTSIEAFGDSEAAKSRDFYDMMADVGHSVGQNYATRVMDSLFNAMKRFPFGDWDGIRLRKKKEYDIASFIEILRLRAEAIERHLDDIISGKLQLDDNSVDREKKVMDPDLAAKFAKRWKEEFKKLHLEHIRAIRDEQHLVAHEIRGQIAQLLEVIWGSTHINLFWRRGIYSSE